MESAEEGADSRAHEYDEETEKMLSQLSLFCALVMNVMCLAGVIGNSLSLFIYTRPAFRKRSINVLLAALSASDLFVCILAIPVFSISQLQEIFPGPQKMTATIMLYFYPVTLMFQTMSVWMLVSITIDRYLAVCHPFKVQSYCTRGRAQLTVAVIVTFSFVYNVVRFWEFQLADSDDADGVEDLVVPLLRANPFYMLWYQNVATLLSQFVLPLIVLCLLNLEVARAIHKAGEQRRQLGASERREHSTAKMMLFVVIVFIFCYTFSFILNVTEILDDVLFRGPVGYLLNDINNILVVVNSSSSFIFYVTYSTRYRSQLRQIWGLRWLLARCYVRCGTVHTRANSVDFSTVSVNKSGYYGSYAAGVKKPVSDRMLLSPDRVTACIKEPRKVSFENHTSDSSG